PVSRSGAARWSRGALLVAGAPRDGAAPHSLWATAAAVRTRPRGPDSGHRPGRGELLLDVLCDAAPVRRPACHLRHRAAGHAPAVLGEWPLLGVARRHGRAARPQAPLKAAVQRQTSAPSPTATVAASISSATVNCPYV